MADIKNIDVFQTVSSVTFQVEPNTNIININKITTESVVATTNLTYSPSATNGVIESDTGSDATIPLADTVNAGLLSPSEKIKLTGIATGAEVNVNADWNATSGDAQILNKPTIPSISGLATVTYVDTQDALKQNNITLTTTGTNGASTLVGATLNIPQYSGATNLTTSQTSTDFTIVSSTGQDAVVLLGDGTSAGASLNNYSTAEKTKLGKYPSTATNGKILQGNGTNYVEIDAPTGGGISNATASGTDTYTATITGVTSYTDGAAFLVRFTNGNTTVATLNINGLGAIALYRNNDGALIGGDIQSGCEMLCVYNSTITAFQCIGTSPNDIVSYVTNADSVTITKGQPVYAFGGVGDRMTVKLAYNTLDATSAQTVGLVMSTSIAAGQKGLIITQGLLYGLSTLPTSTFVDGDTIYLGATAGSITNVKPNAPNHLVYLGVVTTASSGAAGRMYVKPQNGYELDELHNVQAQNPTLKDTLWYDNTVSPAQWKTASVPTILGYTPYNATNPSGYQTAGQVQTIADAKVVQTITNGVTTTAPSQDAVFDALSLKQPLATVLTDTTASYTTAEQTKLAGIATGATANSSNATLLARANHTGTQTASTISDIQSTITNNTSVLANTAKISFDSNNSTRLANTSGTNTGDETTATIKTKLGITNLSGSNTGDQDLSSLATKASPTFTGTPSSPTPPISNNSTRLATTEYVDRQVNLGEPNNITIGDGTATNLTTETLSNTGGYGQYGKNVMVNNGANAINITVNIAAPADFIASYTKLGIGTINFVQGTGATLVGFPTGAGNTLINGIAGSTALLTRTGNIFYLQINNLL